MKRKKKISLYIPLLLAFFLVLGMLIGSKLSNISQVNHFQIYPGKDKITAVLNYIQQEYVDPVSRPELVEATIPEILKNLDPHSVYIPARQLRKYNEPLEGNFSGIGVQFNMQNDTVVIISTIPNGPSEKTGIMAGDRIIEVNDTNVAGVNMSSDRIVGMLKGKKGTRVTIGIYRKGEEDILDFEITRDKIPLTSVDAFYMINDVTGYMKINKFSRTTYQEFKDAVKNLKGQGLTKLILDLRGNGGGYMDAATNIADQFLPEGKLIVYTKGHAKPRTNVYATSKGICLEDSLVVLIDEWSASASEILAGAIQDNDRGIIMGRRSFGKGLVQEQTVFSDGSALRLTIARYYTPTGRCIQKPYDNGSDDYYHDIQTRFERGELLEADSIDLADSLKFKTPGGRIVYGGGGIMPDIFIPIDTSGVTPYLSRVRNRGLIYKFAFRYTDDHRDALSRFEDHTDLDRYLDRQGLLPEFAEFASANGVSKDLNGLEVSGEIILTQIKAYIARNLLNGKGYYPIIRDIDITLQKAIEYISGKTSV